MSLTIMETIMIELRASIIPLLSTHMAINPGIMNPMTEKSMPSRSWFLPSNRKAPIAAG